MPASDFDQFMQARRSAGEDFQAFMSSRQPDLGELHRQAATRMRAEVQKLIPHELRGYTPEELAQPGTFINPRTGQRSTVAGDLEAAGLLESSAPTPNDLLAAPIKGALNVIRGVEQTSEGNPRDIAGGASGIIRGGLEVAIPTLPSAIVAAPLSASVALASGTAAQTATENVLKKLGVPKEYANLAGDIVGIVAGGLAGHGAGPVEESTRPEAERPEAPSAATAREQAPSQSKQSPIAPGAEQAANDFQAFMEERVKSAPPRTRKAAKTEPPPVPNEPRGTSIAGNETRIPIPGENKPPYQAVYALRELEDVQASHQGANFEPNPNYELVNDRNYSKAENAERVVRQSQEFDPSYLVSDNPDATNGPPIVDQRGNTLGGNSRVMILQRVYGSRPAAAQAYRKALEAKAASFGLDPEQVRQMKQPVLVREIPNVAKPEEAITDFNKVGTASLTPAERAVADSRRVSPETLEYLASKVADEGENGTLTKALSGPAGPQIINRLVDDGLITPQERQQYIDDRGVVTPEAKQRVARLMVGRLFTSPAEYEDTPAELRNKAERIIAPLVRVHDLPGWDLTPQVKEAIAILSEARQRGTRNLNDLKSQTRLFGQSDYSPEAFVLADKLQSDGPVKLGKAFRQYAADASLSRNPSFFTPPTRDEAFASAFGEPEGKIDTDEFLNQVLGPSTARQETYYSGSGLAGAVAQLFDRASKNGEPPRDYSGMGAFKSKYLRNLSQLEKANPRAHEAAVTAASSRARASALINAAEPQIEKALGSDGPSPVDFRRALIESRLQGIEQRWRDLATAAESIPVRPEPTGLVSGKPVESRPGIDFVRWVENGPLQLLAAMTDKTGLSEGRPIDVNPAQRAAAMIERGDLEDLRTYVADMFRQAAESVTHVMKPEEFNAATQSQGFKRALLIYKDLLEKPLATSHEGNEGIFSTALGPLDTYYPLTPVNSARKASIIPRRQVPYRTPENINNRFATGLSPDYNASVAALKNKITAAFRTNDRAALLKTLQEEGLLVPLRRGAQVPTFTDENGHTRLYVNVNGKPYQAERVDLDAARIITNPGEESIYVPPPTALLPKWLADELRPILSPEGKASPGLLSRVLNALNQFALAGPADAIFHSHNLLGTLVANTPFIGDSLFAKTIGNTPFTKVFTAITKLATTDPMDFDAAKDLEEMARLGLLPERYGSETFSKQFAQQTGAELKRPFLNWGPLIYGPKGVDIRARLIMYRTAKAMNPNATPLQLYRFTNQLGIYTKALQGSVERAVKSTGLSPFYTAGSTMLKNGINAWLGTSPMPESGLSYRIAQQLSGGAVGTIAAWAAAYKVYTGKWPWDDQRAKLLEVPLNRKDRESRLGIALFGKDMRKVGYVNFGFFSPLVSRGARALGIAGGFNTAVEGGSARQVAEGGLRSSLNSAAHPFLGPIPRSASVALTGHEAYLVRDRRGGSTLLNVLPPGASFGSRLVRGWADLNTFYGGVGSATGFGNPSDDQPGNRWLKSVLDMTGILGTPSDPVATERSLRAERVAIARQKHIREHEHHTAPPPKPRVANESSLMPVTPPPPVPRALANAARIATAPFSEDIGGPGATLQAYLQRKHQQEWKEGGYGGPIANTYRKVLNPVSEEAAGVLDAIQTPLGLLTAGLGPKIREIALSAENRGVKNALIRGLQIAERGVRLGFSASQIRDVANSLNDVAQHPSAENISRLAAKVGIATGVMMPEMHAGEHATEALPRPRGSGVWTHTPGEERQPAALFGRKLKPGAELGNNSAIGQSDALYVPGRRAGDGKVYLNRPALKQILDLDAFRENGGFPTAAMTLYPKVADELISETIERLDNEKIPYEERVSLGRIAVEIVKSLKDSRVVVLVPNTENVSLTWLKGAIRHELFHRRQIELKMSSGTHVDTVKLFRNPVLKRAAGKLRSLGYPKDDEVLAFEASAWLGAGQYKGLGLSREQALAGLRHYFDLLFKQHGEKALPLLERVQPDLRKELYDRFRTKRVARSPRENTTKNRKDQGISPETRSAVPPRTRLRSGGPV